MMAKSTKTRLRKQALNRLIQLGMLAGCLGFGASANAALSFTFDYTDNGGTSEFLGAGNQNRRTALETAGTLFSSYFGSLFSNSGTVTLGVQGTNESCQFGCTLAFAASNAVTNATGFGNGEVVRNKLVNGIDVNGAANDGLVGVNWGAPWELDPGVSVATQNAGNFDFYAALFHEFTHALGFASALSQAGDDGTGTGGVSSPGYWNKFDQFMTDCNGSDLINHGTGLTNLGVYDDAKVSANGKSMCFAGANALAASNADPVLLYAPTTYSPGSSGSHLLSTGANTGAMMKFDRDADIDEPRTYNTITVGVLTDLGYSAAVNAVPEPGTIALVLAALAGLTMRRRKA